MKLKALIERQKNEWDRINKLHDELLEDWDRASYDYEQANYFLMTLQSESKWDDRIPKAHTDSAEAHEQIQILNAMLLDVQAMKDEMLKRHQINFERARLTHKFPNFKRVVKELAL